MLSMARDRNRSFGRKCQCRYYTSGPLTSCDPASPVTSRSTPSLLTEEAYSQVYSYDGLRTRELDQTISTISHLVVRPQGITVERVCSGFGFSLIYRGLDKYEEKDTGIFVAWVEPGSLAACHGLRKNDKILTINSIPPRNVEFAMGVIEQAGSQIKLLVRPDKDITIDKPLNLVVLDKTDSLPRSTEINPGRVTTLGHDGLFGLSGGGHYTASPLTTCNPSSPVPSQRSTQSIMVDEAPGGTWHRTTSISDISQNECGEDGAIRLHVASNLILLIGNIKEIEIIHTI